MSNSYNHLIAQNTAPPGTTYIDVRKSGTRMGKIKVGSLAFPADAAGERKWRALVISDAHVGKYNSAVTSLTRAVAYAGEVGADCIILAGDMANDARTSQYEDYVDAILAGYAESGVETPLYAIEGNHEHNANSSYSDNVYTTSARVSAMTDYMTDAGLDWRALGYVTTSPNICYTVTADELPALGDDVLIFVGCAKWETDADVVFTADTWSWLEEQLATCAANRVFVVTHCPIYEDCGNVGALYDGSGIWDWSQGETTYMGKLKEALKAHGNAILFHGHTHMRLSEQARDDLDGHERANINEGFGYRSVHVPGMTYERYVDSDCELDKMEASEAYVMDVYEHGILLRGRDMDDGEFLPIATYWLADS